MTTDTPLAAPALRRGEQIILGAVLVLAFALRLIRLGTFSYWHDEVHNLIASEDVYALVVHGNLISNHPPLPYLLVALWRALGFGASEWSMRLLPVAFGVGAVGAMFVLGRRLFGTRAGLFAAFLLAIAPLHVYHSQDLKEYIYLPCVAIVMVHWFYRAVESNRTRDWMVYGVLAGLACYTEIFVGPLLVAINFWAFPLLRSKPGMWRRWLAGNALGALLFLPWFSIMLRKAVGTMVKAENWWVQPPSPAGVGFYFKAVAFGYTAPEFWFKIAFVVYLVLVVLGAAAAWGANRRAAALVLSWAIGPVAIVYVISLTTESIFLIRAMLPYAMALYLLAGVGLARVRPAALNAIASLFVVCVAGAGLYHHYLRDYPALDFPHRPGTHPPRDYAKSAEYILAHWQDGDVAVHCSAATWLPHCWYGFRGMPSYFAGVSGKFIADIEMGNPRNSDVPFMENYWPREPQSITKDAKRVWFIFGEWERKYLTGNATDAYRWMDAHFSEIERHSFLGLEVLLYARPDDAIPVTRDHDNGVVADVTYEGSERAYRKLRIDNTLVPLPDEQRKGSLVVSWAEPGQGAPDLILSDTDATRLASFRIENTSKSPVDARLHVVPSDMLIDVPSFYESDPADEIWHVFGQHNPDPPPSSYDMSVASAHFESAGMGRLTRRASLSAGDYATRILTLGTPGDQIRRRSGLEIRFGEFVLYASGDTAPPSPWEWNWLHGRDVGGVGLETPLDITATSDGISLPEYADIAALAFTRIRANGVIEYANPWSAALSLAPRETRQVDVSVDADLRRIDVWVWEHADDGKSYRIFAARQ
ncbi:MAG: glycosyltransferase family 39 protein [Candidatus Hydrogenedentes bacterium]|nr:glycosyltransferase family 39 protein [Candidatus Hydrogenedentota bacterium]